MRQKSQTRQTGAAKAIKDIRRATRKQYSAEEKIRIVLDGLRGEESIAELCRREGIAQMSTAEQFQSKRRSKTSPLNVPQSPVLRVVPVVHRRAPRCFV
jgi:transposase